MKDITIPDTTVTINYPGGTFDIDPLEAVIKAQEILTECKERTDYQHLDLFAAWVKETTGAELKRAHADFLMSRLQSIYLENKKKLLGEP